MKEPSDSRLPRHGRPQRRRIGTGAINNVICLLVLSSACMAAQAQADPCAGLRNCAVDNAVRANVTGVTSVNERGVQKITVRISFSNLGTTPLILNYKRGSGKMADEHGQAYRIYWSETDTGAVTGIPVSTRNKASSQFTLAPGASRAAAFRYERHAGKTAQGTVFEPSLAVEQYDLLPSRQLRLAGEHALYFGQVRAGGSDAARTVNSLRKLLGREK
ncbi:MAG: hypothetical protein QM586_07750 [Xenophilus sp.]